MRILGIDPGSTATGFGVVERRARGNVVHVAHGTLRPPRGAALPARLHFLYVGISDAARRYAPDVVSVEDVFVAASPRSALVLGYARGAALAALAAAGLEVREYATARIKQAVTGNGRADKGQVQRMVRRLLALDGAPPTDASDALAAALCHAHFARPGAAIALPPRPRRPRARARFPARAGR